MSDMRRKPPWIHRNARLSMTILALAIGAGCADADAKCAYQPYAVRGTITATDGRPVAGVKVVVTWRDAQATESETFSSGPDGAFSGDVDFYPYSGRTLLFGEDQCEAKLRSAAILLTAPGYRPSANTLTFSHREATARYVLEPR